MVGLIREASQILRLAIIGGYLAGVILAGYGIFLTATGGVTELEFFSQKFKSTNVGIAAIFIGGTSIVLLIRRTLSSLDRAMGAQVRLPSPDTHTNAQDHPAPGPIVKKLDSAKQIIYDSSKGCYTSDFKGAEGFFWKGKFDKAEKISGQGLGVLEVEGGVLNVRRTNTEGRFEIKLQRYSYNGQDEDRIPENVEISGKRKLRIACQAKVPAGEHSLHFVLKNEKTQDWLGDQTIKITKSGWTDINLLFLVDPTQDCWLRIDDQDVSKAPSSIQIRNLLVEEV